MNTLLAYSEKQSYFPSETINLFIHTPSKYGFSDTINNIFPNQNVKIKKTNNNGDCTLKCILNQITSTPGIYYKVEIDSSIVKIEWDCEIYGDFGLFIHIIDLSGNKIYGTDNIINCI